MLTMLWNNLPTIIGSLIVFGVVGAILYNGFKNRRSGKHSCSCGGSCSGCSGCSTRPRPDEKQQSTHNNLHKS